MVQQQKGTCDVSIVYKILCFQIEENKRRWAYCIAQLRRHKRASLCWHISSI